MGRKRKLENRDAILKASYRLFMSRGYDNVSAQDIEKVSGIHARNFYRYFKGKDEILGALVESVEEKMLEYLKPMLTGDPLFTFVLFSVMKHEFAIMYPDYFRVRASLIERPETFMKSFMKLYALSYPREPDWQSDEQTMLQGLYVLGGTLLVQFAFMENLTGKILPEESSDFMTNYEKHELSDRTAETFRRYMDYAISNNLRVIGLPEDKIKTTLHEAYLALKAVDLAMFRRYYEGEMGY